MNPLKYTVLVTTLVLALLVFLEGISHTYTVVRKWTQVSPNYIQYDAELGWVNQPNTHIADMYGGGTPLTINSQGFRATEEYTKEIPQGKFRVICSGDSFTSGDGVSDSDNWCEKLKTKNSKIESINLGQSAFDIGQMYLRYKREANNFRHNIHVLAFTGYDLDKMELATLNGRGKPVLKLVNGKVEVTNVPVAKDDRGRRTVQLMEGRAKLAELSLIDLTFRILKRFRNEEAPQVVASPSVPREETLSKAIATFKELNETAKKNGQKLLITYLPTYYDYYLGQYSDDRTRLKQLCAENGLTYLDFTETLRTMPIKDIVEGGSGHYKPVVHDEVAVLITKAITPWM